MNESEWPFDAFAKGAFAQGPSMRFPRTESPSKRNNMKRVEGLRRPLPDTNLVLPSIIMGIPFSRWGACPFIVHPFRYPEAACHDIEARPDHETTSEPGILNPVRMAQEWQTMLARDNALTKATIARNMGLSRARVTQIMNLLDLPEPIISFVASLQKPTQIRIVSERKFRAMLELTSKPAQRRAFALLQAELTQAF